MAELKLRKLDTAPTELDYRAIIIVGTGSSLALYVGNADNAPVLMSGGDDAIGPFLLGLTDYDEETATFNIDEETLSFNIIEQ